MPDPICKAAIELVKHFEGLSLDAYLCPAGIPTIGYGHTAGVSLGQRITAEKAEALLADDLAAAAAAVDALVTVPLTGGQRGALASFVFNLGRGNFQSSTLLKRLNGGDPEGAAGEFGRWVNATVQGRKTKLPGLVKRREAETLLFRRNLFLTRMAAADPMPQAVDTPAA
ncbi:lysozyme [Azospirillum sp. B510]|uniref:lysozyme n=1 Tax=Azospirillum sp. (strain B510) TaxID=137722 RepID=UPI0002DDC6F4|nr:lysozyme [Azospirillum sp. B510]